MSNVNTGLGLLHDNEMNHHIDNKAQLTALNTKLDNLSGAGNNNLGDGATKLQTYCFGRDATNGQMKPLKLDTSGRLECSVDALEITAETINLSTDTLETLITSTNTKLTAVDAVLDASLVKQTNLETLITTLDGVQDNALTKLGEIETSANSLISANHTDLVALEASLTSMEGKQDTQTTHLSEIEGAVETLEACVGSSKVNVNISSGNISGFSTEAKQDTVITHVDGIETLLTATNSKIDAFDAVLDASLVKQTAMASDVANIETLITSTNALISTLDGVQDSALTKLGEIETSADALIAANHTDLVALEASLTSMEGKQDTVIGHVNGVETLITATNSAISTFDAVLDASLVKQTAMASDVANIETLITSTNALISTLDGVQDSALTKLGEIDTAIDTLDAVVDAVLVKLTPVKSHTVAISGAKNGGDIVFSSAIDVRTIKHFDVIASDTNLVSATVSVVGSITSGGAYIPIASSGMATGALTGSLRFQNSAFKFIKVKLLNGGEASNFTIIVYMSS